MNNTDTTQKDWKKEFDDRFVDKQQISEDEFDVGFKGNVQDLYDFIKEQLDLAIQLEREKQKQIYKDGGFDALERMLGTLKMDKPHIKFYQEVWEQAISLDESVGIVPKSLSHSEEESV